MLWLLSMNSIPDSAKPIHRSISVSKLVSVFCREKEISRRLGYLYKMYNSKSVCTEMEEQGEGVREGTKRTRNTSF